MNHQDTKFTKEGKNQNISVDLKEKSFLGALGALVVKGGLS